MRVCAAEVIGIGPAAKAAVPLLIRAIEENIRTPTGTPRSFAITLSRRWVGSVRTPEPPYRC